LKPEIYRHGDLILKPVSHIPTDAKNVNSKVLAHGENGHTHELKGNCQILETEQTKFIQANEPLELIHEEHKTILINPGFYELIKEQELDPYKDVIRVVRD